MPLTLEELVETAVENQHLILQKELEKGIPLNYIDLFSRIQLEEVILEYQPTMLLVEHDRTFCRRVGTDFLLLDAE
jgi:lincosamide and streptogramin A transport system ATP-binding/permease protein